ncbi:MAG: HAD family phosphatase [Lachnospiraceae bacterium]|jgi:Cof subfamily protein (haloacid dehalogenase superfamily)|nr:HAD family phosphatase [Lachnospiraceae bacterium]
MDIRLIALDLDGTLLTTDKRVTKYTVGVLSRAAERGIYIVPATGRSLTGLSSKIRSLPFVRYAITVNGAAVWDMEQQKLIMRRAFSKEQAVELWDFISRYHTMQDACIDGIARMAPEYYNKVEEFMPDEPRRLLIRSTRKPTENLRNLVSDEKTTVEKFNLFFRADAEEKRQQAKTELEELGGLSVTSSLGNNLEINHADATKGRGLLSLAAYLGLSAEQLMAFGDGENDISMLQAAGLGAAMENAPKEVKAAADWVTLSNDEEGVAYGIEKYVLTDR